jgi:hypothetical protein
MKEKIEEMLEGPLPPRVAALLDKAEEFGWEAGHHSFVVRLYHPDAPLARPFFASWDLVKVEAKKPSWRFTRAYASNTQALNLSDVMDYLEDPAVIWPEPPEQKGD